jgi:hypothetical protein
MLVEFNLGTVLLLQGHTDEAAHHFDLGRTAGDKALDTYLRPPWWYLDRRNGADTFYDRQIDPIIYDLRDSRRQYGSKPGIVRQAAFAGAGLVFGVAAGATLGGAVVLTTKYLTRQRRQLIRDCGEFVKLYNLNECAATAVVGRQPQYLVFTADFTGAHKYGNGWLREL